MDKKGAPAAAVIRSFTTMNAIHSSRRRRAASFARLAFKIIKTIFPTDKNHIQGPNESWD